MSWPSPNEFTDALRNPAAAFADAELAACDPVVGPDGRPAPHPGDTSGVYQLCAEDGREWAVKCFTRPPRADRYPRIRDALARAALPCAAGFTFLEEGVRVRDRWYPVLKMGWVEGLPLNRVARDRAESPAVMETLLRRWVQLCGELRAAGIAHGDLQHNSAILVPGKWPGSYVLGLIDFDGAYVPELANEPSDEVGHANYQHPRRAADGTYSPDVDRFPHLVIATALKALAVLGPSLWQRYGTGENLLFTAADFRDPAGSGLMRELWQTNHPALRALVGRLAIACGQPLAQTPWLDELVVEGAEKPLSDEETKAAAVALGFGLTNFVPLEAAFTLDDEPPPAAPRPAAARAVPAPVEAIPLDDEPEEEDEPRPRHRREPTQRVLWGPIVVAAGVLLLAVGVIAGVIIGGRYKTTEAARPQPDAPKTNPAPPGPAPAPPQPQPQLLPEPPNPPQPPPFAGPTGFYLAWAKPSGDERSNVKAFFADDGRTVYVATGGRVEAFDAKTGAAWAELRGPGLPTSPLHLWTLDRDRVAVFGFPQRAPGLWDAKTGDPLPALPARDVLPPAPAGVQPTAIECQLSPDGKYLFAGYQGPLRGQGYGPAPYRLTDLGTGKVLAQGDWSFGTARFTADGARLLVTETNGRVRWLKVPGGEVEIEWQYQPNGFPRFIGGMSADGSLFVYFGRPPGQPFDSYLIDGKTGQVLRKLGPFYGGDRSALTADGKWLVGVVNDPTDLRRLSALVTDARTGEVLVRTPIEGTLNEVQRAAVTPDGRALVLHHRGRREVAVYELRGAVPPAPANVQAPPPLGPVPPRVPPGAVAFDPPPLPPPPPPPAGGFPDVPAMKPRWSVATETGIMSNGLPQTPLYTKDGKTVVLSGGMTGTILTFDAKTGAAGAAYDGHKGPGGVYWLAPFGDRVVSGGFDAKRATWDVKTGRRLDEEVKFPELPPLPDARKGHAGITYTVSPGGRYAVAARRESGRPPVAGPLRVLDTTTGEVVLKADWNGGRILFTADESRVFVLNGLGKAAWYKLPSGEADGEWAAEGPQAEFARVMGMTADGKSMLYFGPLKGQPHGPYLLDGTTGRVVRRLNGAPYQAGFSALSPDGRFVVTVVIDFARGAAWYADVFEVATWRAVGRLAPPEKGVRDMPQFGFSPDGKDLTVFYPQAKEMRAYALPEAPAP
jgi:hypothetical protein